MEEEFTISTDKLNLDIGLIHNFLSNRSYWAKGRTYDEVVKSIDHSVCFGLYKDHEQIGFTRVITDYAVTAWILDVFIIEPYRKKGLGTYLFSYILDFADFYGIKTWRLGTDDAHEFYKQFGFKSLEKPQNIMELKKR
ncbi:MAG: GNAT family N-acetyltransferase [Bacteroidales bacterium]|nr:GNAT family N-acetyltransferase [Bacteroidales bacterium]